MRPNEANVEPNAARDQSILRYYERAMDGHVYIRETVGVFLDTLAEALKAFPAPRLLELGSHAGFITSLIRNRAPQAEILVCDEDESLVALSRRQLADSRVSYHVGPLSEVRPSVDVVVSVARHHHLPHDYLRDLRRIMNAGGVYIVADELCPEYCFGEFAERIAQAKVLDVVGGYLLTTEAEVNAYRASGSIPAPAQALETRRKQALWSWYRYVVDEAVARGYFDIAVGELQSAHDDLITGSEAEHKFSTAVVERQFALAGFRLVSKRSIGAVSEPTRQSMFVYTFTPA